jgi:ABC-2 type transport system permease protein
MRAAGDGVHGINDRLRSMPVASVVPSLARALANSALLVVSLFWAVLSGLVIGWRPQHGVGYFLGYLAVAFAIGLILAIAGDAVGVITNDPVACSQAMALPQLILGMLSTGFVPISQFPEWITPFVRNQPISQFAELMRSLDTGTVDTGALLAPCLWAGGIAVFALAAAGWALGRGRTR